MEDPQKYGVVVYDEMSGEIEKFVEKPKTYVSNKINAGLYMFNQQVLDRIQVSCGLRPRVHLLGQESQLR